MFHESWHKIFEKISKKCLLVAKAYIQECGIDLKKYLLLLLDYYNQMKIVSNGCENTFFNGILKMKFISSHPRVLSFVQQICRLRQLFMV